jgi:hypothetical protein
MRTSIRVLVASLGFASAATGLAGLALSSAQGTGDEAVIIAATHAHFAALNAGNLAEHLAHHLPGNSAFASGGSLLDEFSTPEDERVPLQADLDRGVRFNLQLRHLQVKVYGNAAVVTGYVVGTVRQPDGTTQEVRDRRSALLIKQGAEWREAHTHSSSLSGVGQ